MTSSERISLVIARPDPERDMPSGWYCIGTSADFRPRRTRNVTLADRALVAFRTESGRLALLDAHCAHMGAHLGHGGTVEGECVRCPFHRFRYGPDGRCVETGYGTKVPPKLRVTSHHVVEQNGLVLAYYAPDGSAPTWTVPPLAEDDGSWTTVRATTRRITGSPQEVSENSVDLGHFVPVHRYLTTEMLGEVTTEGELLRSAFDFTIRGPGGLRMKERMQVHVHGLGYSYIDLHDSLTGCETRLFVLPTPIGPNRIELRLAVSVRLPSKTPGARWWIRWLPAIVAKAIVAPLVSRAYVKIVGEDVPIWENKKYLARPRLAEGDGPIMLYRRWARQFYAEPAEQQRAAPVSGFDRHPKVESTRSV